MKSLPLLILLLAVSCSAAEPSFDTYWHDGKAELDAYQLKVMRYGEARDGKAVLVYVTEPFSESHRVKVNDAEANPSDTFEALKLNLIRDFQTGIYDYNTMLSVFVRSSDLTPVKISFSSQEWCGNVYEELLFYPDRITGHLDSYFEGESGPRILDHPRGGVPEDALFILLRGLRGPYLEPGESRSVPFLPGSFFGRLSHRPLAWTTATIRRMTGKDIVYTVDIADGRQGKFWIESEYPHRIRRWVLPPDLSAELIGHTRLAYWKHHDQAGEKYLKELGLSPSH